MRGFLALAADAVRDAVRRRLAIALAGVALLTLWAVEGCTSCRSKLLLTDGQALEPAALAGVLGAALYGWLSLLVLVLAGLVACDHLSRTLRDRTAALVLARPVGRATYALARLAGALGLALATGALLLAATAGLLHARHALSFAPAAFAAAACGLGAVTVAALAMTVSLALPRVAGFLFVLGLVAAVAGVNLASLAGARLSGAALLLDQLGPPLGTGLALALSPWSGRAPPADAAVIALRLAVWAVASVGLLGLIVRRIDVES